ncbi:alpha/beta fold hydrolase [Nocardia sp. NPDC088792]|uniref:alpha/beta fold hydrolase n=1 Tax=Nocardia sp. NPDC088792 TaxID=3364332 RepID=UPI00382FF719
MQTQTAVSPDGTAISYTSRGGGPGLVIVPGLGRMAHHYNDLADLLAIDFTTYVIERRGRGESGGQGENYCIEREAEDVRSLLRETGTTRLFGHSYGGLIGLHAVLEGCSLEQLAVYDPGVSVNGSIPEEWWPGFEKAYRHGDSVTAQALMLRGLRLNALCTLPLPLVKLLARLILTGKDGAENTAVMTTFSAELREIFRLDSTGERYKSVTVPTLLTGGAKSPDYFRTALDALQSYLPDAQRVSIPKLEHNAPDLNAPRVIAEHLRSFFLATP